MAEMQTASSNLSSVDDDDTGSLFEGMILFTSPSVSDQPPDQDVSLAGAASSSSADASNGSIPLDENLFSDLTIIAPSPTSEASQSPVDRHVPLSLARQTSNRKKKKAAGLRIGYGRDKDGTASIVPEDLAEPSQVENTEHEEYQLPIVVSKAEDLESSCSSGDGREELSGKICNESTIESRLEAIRSGINEKLDHSRKSVVSLSAERKIAIKKRRIAAENLSQASTRHKELEKELEEACELEDFEKAERISDSLATAEIKKDHLVDLLRKAEAEYDSLDSKMMEALEYQIGVEQEAASLLQKFSQDTSNDTDIAIENTKEVCSKEIELCISSTEQLELQIIELEIESQLIQEIRLSLTDNIEHSMETERKELDLYSKKREILQEDLNKLLALVKQKEIEISENDFKIEIVEKKIANGISSSNKVKSDLDTRLENLRSEIKLVNSEKNGLTKKNEETKRLIQEEEIRSSNIKESLRIYKDEANLFQEAVALRKKLLQITSDFVQNKSRLMDIEENLTRDLHILKQELSSARASLQELSASKSNTEQELDTIKQRLIFIEKRLPELETEKKIAASARNFKEASRISTETKSLAIEQHDLNIRTENAISEITNLDERISNTINKIRETEPLITSKEKESAITSFRKLILNADVANAERSAAMELGDHEEAEVLDAEARDSINEAKKLQALYEFGDEEDVDNITKHFVPLELISKHGNKQLTELSESLCISL